MYKREEDEQEIDLLEYWRIILKRKWIVAACTGALVLFAGIYSFKATPKYKAVSTVMIEEESSKILDFEDEFGYRQMRSDLRHFNTQLRLLKSKSLSERVALKLDLLNHPLYKPKDKRKESESDIPLNPYSGIARALGESMDVSPVRDTKLVELSFISPNPALAAQIVNSYCDEFIEFYIEKRHETTELATRFLNDQIASLQTSLAVKEEELQKYSQEKGLYFLSDEESTIVNNFADLNTAFTQAQIDRINAETRYREFSGLAVDSLPQYIDNPVIQNLKTEFSRIQNEFEEKSKLYKPEFPDMVRLKARLDSMRSQLGIEISKAVDSTRSEFRAAQQKENSLKNLLDEQKNDVTQMNSNAIIYNSINIEVQNMRKLLDSLVERQKETMVSSQLGGLKTSQITIIDRAEPPRSPVSPKKKLNLMLAFIIGLFGGVGLCFVLEYLDNTVKTPDDLDRKANLPSLGVIPYLSPNGLRNSHKRSYYRYHYADQEDGNNKDELTKINHIELVNHLYPKLFVSEDYRTVRTSLLLSYADHPPKNIVFTSASPKEGKTSTVVNMAVSFAQLGKKVLVVDADLRRPRIHKIFKLKNHGGLSNYLTGKVVLDQCVEKTEIPNISIIPSGPVPPNPSELLNSDRMKAIMDGFKKGFDVILIDTPPVLAVIDAVIIASMADGVVLVIKSGGTTDKAMIAAREELRRGNVKVLGGVINGIRLDKGDYYSSRYKSPYQYGDGGGKNSSQTDLESSAG